MPFRLSVLAAGFAVASSFVSLASPAQAESPSFGGCISEDGTGGLCTDGASLSGITSVAVSSDRNSVYAAASASDAVAILQRNTGTGGLTYFSCVSNVGTNDSCSHMYGLAGAASVAISPGSRNVYVASATSGAIVVMNRNFTNGALTIGGCFSATDSHCTSAVAALNGANSVTVSPDGTSLYATSSSSDSLVVFNRNTDTGALTFATCFSQSGSGSACTIGGPALDGATNVTVSPDNKNVYVASSVADAVIAFSRNTTTGALTPVNCVGETSVGGLCTDSVALDNVKQITVSPDGKNAYAASWNSGAVAVFNRDATTGALTPASPKCISDTGSGGACTDGSSLDQTSSVVVSPDNKKVFVAASGGDAIVAFDRDTTSGALTRAGCISDDGSGGSCTDGTALDSPSYVTVSPEGYNVYAGVLVSGSLDTFSLETDVFRFWSPKFNNAHFFTASKAEADNLRATDPNWTYEGVVFKVRNASNGSCAVGSPVFRFFSSRFASHFYTISVTERNAVQNDANWSYEGAAYCAFPTQEAGTTALYRFWSPVFGKHFFTSSQAEADHIRTTDSNWTYEGPAYYVLP